MADVATNPDVLKRKDGLGIRQRRARVTFSYEPQHEDELALKVGDELIIEAEDEEGWYQATLRGKSGVCPSNFVEVLPDETGETGSMAAKIEVKPDKEKEQHKDKVAATSSLPRGSIKEKEKEAESRAATLTPTPTKETPAADSPHADDGKGERTAKKIVGVGFGNIFKDGGVKLKATGTPNGSEKHVIGPAAKKERSGSSASVDSKDTPEARPADRSDKDKDKDKEKAGTPNVNKENVNTDNSGSSSSEYCKADFDYKAANGDELSFQVGDVIRVVNKNCEDDGWWMGELNGRSGVFPDNFVSLIPASQAAAPKRPARPIATEKNMTVAASEKKDESSTEKKDVSSVGMKEEPKPDKTAPAKPPTPSSSTSSIASADKVAKTETATPPPRPEKPSKPVISKKPVTPSSGSKSREDSPLADTPEKPVAAGHARSTSVGSDAGVNVEAEEPRAASVNSIKGVVMRHAHAHTNGHGPGHAEGYRASTIVDSIVSRHRGGSFDDVLTGQKLNHMTTSRPKGPQRRPPSMIRPNSEPEDDGKLTPDLDVIEEPPFTPAITIDTAKSITETVSVKEKETPLAKKNSFLKEGDSAGISRACSPSVKQPSTVPAPNLEEEVRHLREEVKSLKDTFASQIHQFEELLKAQTSRVSALEKELEELRKMPAK